MDQNSGNGADVYVRFETTSLDAAKAFIAEVEKRWDSRLEALREFVEERQVVENNP